MLELSTIGLFTAFVAGIASFLSPCVLPLVPGYLSFVAGGAVAPTASPMEVRLRRWRTLGLSACFVLGFSSVFLILGASITAIGRLFRWEERREGTGGVSRCRSRWSRDNLKQKVDNEIRQYKQD